MTTTLQPLGEARWPSVRRSALRGETIGPTRGRVMMAVGLVAAALFGFGVEGWYDRKGLHRVPLKATPEKAAVPA